MSLTEKEKEARKNRLFATDVARIMTGNGFRVALEKMGEIPDSGDELDEVEEIQLGNLLEPKILDAYEAERGPQQLIRRPSTMIHPEQDWLGCHLDAISIEQSGLVMDVECKAVGWYNRKYWGDGGDEIPNRVLWQVISQMAAARFEGKKIHSARIPVCFLDSAAFTAYILGKQLPITIFAVTADSELEEMIFTYCREVWENINAGRLPLPQTHEDVKLLYQRDKGEAIDCPDEILWELGRLTKVREAIKKLQSEKDRCEFIIKEYMKEAAFLRRDNYTVATWKNDADSFRFDTELFAKENPDDYLIYMKPKTGDRKFLPKEKIILERINDSREREESAESTTGDS